jgi:hypothetical protein
MGVSASPERSISSSLILAGTRLGGSQKNAEGRPFSYWMVCQHDGFHAIRTTYDRATGVLVYFWTCERCGRRLGEARREEYRPAFDPRGNRRFLVTDVR